MLRREIYACVSLVVAVLYLFLLRQGVDEGVTQLAAFSVGLLLRMVAIRWRVSLPVFRYSQARWG